MKQYMENNINIKKIDEQHFIIDDVLNKIEHWDYPEFPGTIFSLQGSFFRIMNLFEKEKYAEALIFLWKKQDKNSCMALEILGHVGKYLSFDINSIVLDVIDSFIKLGNDSFAIYLLDFFKAVWKVCNLITRDRINRFINTLAMHGTENLRKQISYTNIYFSCRPIKNEEATVLFLIPEFLTSSSFLQQPLDFMETVSLLENYNIFADILDNRVHNYSLKQLKSIVDKYEIVVVTSCPIDMVQKYYLDYRYAIFCVYVLYLKDNIPLIPLIIWGAHSIVKPEWVYHDVGEINIVKEMSVISLFKEIIKVLGISINLSNIKKYDLRFNFTCVDMQWYYGRFFCNGISYQLHDYSILQLSKGCPYRCLFCYRHNGNNVAYLSLKKSIMLINSLIERGIHNVFFIDSSFTVNRRYIITLCNELIRMGVDISWQCETRADLLDTDLLAIMKRAGCKTIWIGFESFDMGVLEKNNKGITSEKQLEAIKIIRESGIECCGFIMLGMPGETIESMNNTINFVINNKIPLSKSINRCTVRPGSLLFDIALHDCDYQIDSFYDLEAFSGIILNDITETDLQIAEKKLKEYLQN